MVDAQTFRSYAPTFSPLCQPPSPYPTDRCTGVEYKNHIEPAPFQSLPEDFSNTFEFFLNASEGMEPPKQNMLQYG